MTSTMARCRMPPTNILALTPDGSLLLCKFTHLLPVCGGPDRSLHRRCLCTARVYCTQRQRRRLISLISNSMSISVIFGTKGVHTDTFWRLLSPGIVECHPTHVIPKHTSCSNMCMYTLLTSNIASPHARRCTYVYITNAHSKKNTC